MKGFISADLEGMPYIVIPGHLSLKGSLYDEARRIATVVTLAVAEELHNNGFSEIVIADSHGPMVNLLVDDLPEYVEIIRGYPRPVSMISGAEQCDAIIFLGYHAKFGTVRSTFDHTYSGGTINRVEVNQIAVSEFLLNAYAAGELGIPVIMVAGDAQLLKTDVEKHAPWAETVALKHALSRVAAKSYSMARIKKELRKATQRGVAKFKGGSVELLTARKPVKTKVTFLKSHFADAAELLPIVDRLDGLSVEYTARDIIEGYKIFEMLVLASHGITSLLEARK